MISLLHDCELFVDNGYFALDNSTDWVSEWETESFIAGEEIDETDQKIDISSLTEGEDFVRID